MSKSNGCCHPIRLQSDRRKGLGGRDKYRRGGNLISTGLALSMNDAYSLSCSAKVVDPTSDILCTSCSNFETNHIGSLKSSDNMDIIEGTRFTVHESALMESAWISNQSRNDHIDLGEQAGPFSSDDMVDETPQMETVQR